MTQDEVDELNDKYKEAIPRMYSISNSRTNNQVSHIYMLNKLDKFDQIENFRGFSVTPREIFSEECFNWTSRSLNPFKDNGLVTLVVQDKILDKMAAELSLKKEETGPAKPKGL